VGQAAARSEAHQVWRLVGQAEALHQIEAALHVVTHRNGLLTALAELLPRLGVRRCRLALYVDPTRPEGEARLIFALDKGVSRPLPADGLPFAAVELLPAGFWPTPESWSLAIEALHFGDEQFGFVLFEVDPQQGLELGTIYEALRSQISSALMSVQLYDEVERARKEAETANELKSRFLSVVSHELRTPLNLIVGLCEMAAWEQARRGPADPHALLTAILAYQEQIHAGAQHLDRLIRDVLDLASSQVGQLKLTCEALDPAALTALEGFSGVLWWGDAGTGRALARALAAREGPILPLITAMPDRGHVAHERHVCVDTTASGGNAALLAEAASA
jgi:signal transduction histidine kinase